jgi:hypothetical protein
VDLVRFFELFFFYQLMMQCGDGGEARGVKYLDDLGSKHLVWNISHCLLYFTLSRYSIISN